MGSPVGWEQVSSNGEENLCSDWNYPQKGPPWMVAVYVFLSTNTAVVPAESAWVMPFVYMAMV